jgi:hypothetical protein
MPTRLSVFNGALRLLEQTALQDPDAAVDRAERLRDAWDSTVLRCFEADEWNFARLRAQLSRVDPAPLFGWRYYYNLPADIKRLVFVSETGEPDDPLRHYIVENGKIATDAETVYVAYMSTTVRDFPGKWGENFAAWVSAELAYECLALNTSAADKIDKERLRRSRMAIAVDAVQNPPAERQQGSWASAARRGSGREMG